MSLRLTCRIDIGNYTFAKASGVEIQSSWKDIGDSATIKLYGRVDITDPSQASQKPLKDVELEGIINVGDAVNIELGYDGELKPEFVGYVAEIKRGIPFEIRCEDAFFKLKRISVNRTWKNTTLPVLLHEMLDGLPFVVETELQNVKIDVFRADKTSAYGVLKKLKEQYLLCAYFRTGKLFVGLPYTEFTSATANEIDGSLARYSFQQNVVSDDLNYTRKQDVRIKAKVVAIHRNNKRTMVEAGDPDGVERTITLRTEVTDKATLQKKAQEQLDSFKYDGYRGSFTSFGIPYAVHSGVADLHDERCPQHDGRYLINKVATSFGPGGFRRTVELGKKATF